VFVCFEEWSVEDVLQWLEGKGLKDECELFKGWYISHILRWFKQSWTILLIFVFFVN